MRTWLPILRLSLSLLWSSWWWPVPVTGHGPHAPKANLEPCRAGILLRRGMGPWRTLASPVSIPSVPRGSPEGHKHAYLGGMDCFCLLLEQKPGLQQTWSSADHPESIVLYKRVVPFPLTSRDTALKFTWSLLTTLPSPMLSHENI